MKLSEQTLGSLAVRSTSGGTPATGEPSYYGGEIPWLRTQEVNFNYIYETEIKITDAGLENSSAKWIAENSVIVALYGNSAGRVAMNKIPLTTNQACGNLTIDPTKADYRFVYYALLKDYEVLHGMAKGAAQNNLNLAMVKDYKLRVPELTIQRQIADILSAYDEAMENNRRRMGLLEKAARLLYEEWFVRLRFPGHEHTTVIKGLPKGWECKPLNAICPDLREAANPTDLEPGTPYIGLEHMPRRSITLLDWGTAEDVTSTKLRYLAGDILFGKIRPYFHKVGFALTDGVTSSDAIVLRPSEPLYYSFALLTVSSDWFVNIVSKTAKEGSKMPRADWNLMEMHSLVVPPRALLETLNETIKPMLDQLRTLALQNLKLRAARELLLPRLMSGEIEV